MPTPRIRLGNTQTPKSFIHRPPADLGVIRLRQRAEIGAAVSAISAGNAENGMAELEKIFKSAAKSAYSAQAGYLLGLAKAQSGKADEAKAIFKELSGSEQNGIFAILAGQELSNLN